MIDFLETSIHSCEISILKWSAILLSIVLFFLYHFKSYKKTKDEDRFKGILSISIFSLFVTLIAFYYNFSELFDLKNIKKNPLECIATIISTEKKNKTSRTAFYTFYVDGNQTLANESSKSAQIGEQYKVYVDKTLPKNCKIDFSKQVGFDSIFYNWKVLNKPK